MKKPKKKLEKRFTGSIEELVKDLETRLDRLDAQIKDIKDNLEGQWKDHK